jgi:ABC-type multidrug transport system fused ATPase/permease subunit
MPPIFVDGRRRTFARLVLWGLIQGAGAVATVILIKAVFDQLAIGKPAAIVGFLAGLAVAAVLIFCVSLLWRADAERLGHSYVSSCRLRMYDLLRQRSESMPPRRRGLMMARFVSDLSAARLWVSRGLARLVTGSIATLGALVGAIVIEPRLALAAAMPFLLAGGLVLVLRGRLLVRIAEMRRRRGRVSAHVGEMLESLNSLSDSDAQRERRRLRKRSRALRDAAIQRGWRSETLRAGPRLASGIAIALVLGLAATGSVATSVGDVVALMSVIGFLTQSCSELAQSMDYRLNYLIARQKLETCNGLSEPENQAPPPIEPVSRDTIKPRPTAESIVPRSVV